MSIIEVKGLNKIYKEKDIFKCLKGQKRKIGVKNISFKVDEGEIFSIIGLNGAGKTTIMKSILALIEIDSGEIKIFNKDHLSLDIKKHIGYLPEISYYPQSVSLKTIMTYYGEMYGLKGNDLELKIDNALKMVGLSERKKDKLKEFSKGMLQKVGIAQAIMNEPKILFLDEPMSGLDPLARKMVIEIIKRFKDLGSTVFLNTHILSDIEEIGERVLIVNQGKLIKELDLREKRGNRYKIICENKIIETDAKSLDEKLKNIKQSDKIKSIMNNDFSLSKYFEELVSGGVEC